MKIHYSITKRLQQLTYKTYRTIQQLGFPIGEVMDGFVEYLQREQGQSETTPIIIARGGYLRDFPILLACCMNHNYDNPTALYSYMFVDSMQGFQSNGYTSPGLYALCKELGMERM